MKLKLLLLFSTTLLVLTLFSCQNPNSNKTFTAVDNKGTTHIVAKNENGFIKVNDDNNMIEYATNENGEIKKDDKGEIITEISAFPYYLKHENIIECAAFKLDIPDSWENQKSQTIKLTHKETKAEISFSIHSSDTAENLVKEIEDLYADWDAEFTKETVKLSYAQAIKLESLNIKPNAKTTFYIFNINDQSYAIKTTVYDAMQENVDCFKIINSVEFKK